MTPTPPGWDDILDDDESNLWQGAPDARLRLSGGLGLSAFGLFFAGFALFWMAAASMIGTSIGLIGLIFPLFGLPFQLVGLHMVAGRFLWDAYVRRGTFYTLTSKRAYSATAILGQRRLASYNIFAGAPVELVQGPPDLVFFSKRGTPARQIGFEYIFEYISDGRRVFDPLRQVQKDAA